MMRRSLTGEQGAVVVLVAIVALVLFGFVALALDGGLLFGERRDVQNTADHAALNAAWAACQGTDPVAAGLASAARNGFDNDAVTNMVTINDLGGGVYEAVVRSTFDAAFSQTIGHEKLRVAARAVAQCEGGGAGGYAIFAGSTTCQNTIDWSGSNTQVLGGVHTNNDLHVGGQSNTIVGSTTYISTVDAPPGKITYHPPPPANPTQLANPPSFPGHADSRYPVDFAVAWYEPTGTRAVPAAAAGEYHNAANQKIDMGWLEAHGLWNDVTNTVKPGLYYTEADIDLSASDITGDRVTFVSGGGVISLSGSSHNLTPWDPDGLLVFSNRQDSPNPNSQANCNVAVVKLAGSTHLWNGIIYAPRGLIEMSGSVNTTLNGSLTGLTVRLNGSVLNVAYDQDYGGGQPTLRLLE